MKPHALLFAGHSENFQYVSDGLTLRGKTIYELSQNDIKNMKRATDKVI